jgi:two-component system NtrC family sensor kinase
MLPGIMGIEVIRRLQEKGLDVPMIMITSQGSIKVAVEAMKLGAYDYVVKDEDYFKTMYMVVDSAVKRYNLDRRNRELQEEIIRKNTELIEANEKLLNYQRQIIQSEKMASLVTLVKGISHEMNNPLTGILGFTQLLLQNCASDTALSEDLKEIEKNALRCREIVAKLGKFCQTDLSTEGPVSLEDVLEDSLSFMEFALSERRIAVAREHREEAPFLRGSRQDMQQAILAVLMNAMQAMESTGGGTLTVRILRGSEKEIVLEIADTGVGIPPENIDKIFNPFFTTRDVGQGFGLGLSVAYGIMKDFQGRIDVESSPGEGSVFRLTFPTACEVSAVEKVRAQ